MPIHRRRASAIVLSASLLGGGACSPAAQEAAPPAPPAPPAAPTEPIEILGLPFPGPRRSADVTPAVQAIERMVMAYRAVPVLVDEMVVQEIYMGRPQPEARVRVILGPGTDCEIQSPGSRAVTIGDSFYYESMGVRSRYLTAPFEENIVHMMREVARIRPALAWHAKSRYGDPADSVLFSLSLGVPDPTTITGYENTRLPDGREVHRVTLQADTGWSVVTIDAKTNFLIALDSESKPRGAPIETFRISRHVRSNPQVFEELPTPITFEPGSRRPVSNYNAFIGRTVANEPVPLTMEVGDVLEAPTLFTIEGMPWGEDERRGRVQVVIAWNLSSVAFRNGPVAVKALRRNLEERTDPVPVDLWLMNTREEREETEDGGGKWDAVYEYWYATEFDIPCIFDEQDVFADLVGLKQFPAVLVFDTKGRLVGTQGGLSGGWIELVEALIDSAVAASVETEEKGPVDGEGPAGGDAGNDDDGTGDGDGGADGGAAGEPSSGG